MTPASGMTPPSDTTPPSVMTPLSSPSVSGSASVGKAGSRHAAPVTLSSVTMEPLSSASSALGFSSSREGVFCVYCYASNEIKSQLPTAATSHPPFPRRLPGQLHPSP
eukprot:26612-Rhodomonas_salina.2